jgi:hypothetical protein
LNAILAAATAAETASRRTKLSRPNANATGIVVMTPKRDRSIAIITARLRRRSTHGASGTAIKAPTAGPTADSAATCAGLACNTRTAISGSAPNPSPEPYALTA